MRFIGVFIKIKKLYFAPTTRTQARANDYVQKYTKNRMYIHIHTNKTERITYETCLPEQRQQNAIYYISS